MNSSRVNKLPDSAIPSQASASSKRLGGGGGVTEISSGSSVGCCWAGLGGVQILCGAQENFQKPLVLFADVHVSEVRSCTERNKRSQLLYLYVVSWSWRIELKSSTHALKYP